MSFVTCRSSLDLFTPNVVENIKLGNLGLLDWFSGFAVGNIVTSVKLSIENSSDAHLALEVVIVDVGDKHLKRVVFIDLRKEKI